MEKLKHPPNCSVQPSDFQWEIYDKIMHKLLFSLRGLLACSSVSSCLSS